MSTSITLQVGGLDRHKDPTLDAYPLRLTVTAATGGIPKELFVIHVTPEFPKGYFHDLATVDLIESLPSTLSGLSPNHPFVRCASVTLVFQTHTDAAEFSEDMKRRLSRLALDWDNASQTLTSETVVVTGAGVSNILPSSVIEIPLRVLPEFVPDVVDDYKQVVAGSQPNSLLTYFAQLRTNYGPTSATGHNRSELAVGAWVPVAYAPSTWVVPEGARFFYNYGNHMGAFRPALPLLEDKVDVIMNGIVLPKNIVYVVTDKTLFWLDYDPQQVAAVAFKSGNAPWPIDYVDLNDPGTDPVNLTLRVYT